MKKIVIITLFFLLFSLSVSNACIIEFEPNILKIKKGEIGIVKLHLKYEHRRCEITLDDTEYETKGIKIIEKGKWVKIKRGDYSRTIKIKLISDKGTLKIIRECTKKGISEGILKIRTNEKK